MKAFLTQWWRLVIAVLLLWGAVQLFVRPVPALTAVDAARANGSSLFRPVFSAVDLVRQGVGSVWSHYLALVGVTRENDELRREVVSLREKLQEHRDALLENRRLKELLQFSQGIERRSIGARVVGHDISPWFQAVFIDAGVEQGVEPGMAVVTPAGAVGRIHRAYKGLSSVILLTDGRFAGDVIVERSRVRAVAEGMGGGFCRLKYVAASQDVVVGDRVLFSGFDGSMPKGVLLGVVVSVDRPKESLFQTVKAVSSVNFQGVEEVLVILSRPSIPRGEPR